MSTPKDSDDALRAWFAREHRHVAEQPFLRDMLKRVAAARTRRAWMRRALQAAALVAVIVLSPWLIEASSLLSAKLDELFTLVSERLSTPAGIVVVALGGGGGWLRRWPTF
jgi:hypothetical protein